MIRANGLTEEYKPSNFTFTDKELLDLFANFEKIRSHRLSEIPNTWCIWGENIPIDKRGDEFNEFGSELIDDDIYSPLFMIHDTEINSEWKLTDPIIQFGYEEYRDRLYKYLDETAILILEEREKERIENGENNNIIVLEQTGITEDKRIIFKFDLSKQTEDLLLQPKSFWEFANKVYTFLDSYYKDGDIFVIYADKNIIIEVEDNRVKALIEKIISLFQSKEDYEKCSKLKFIYDSWEKYKIKNPAKNPDKNKQNNNSSNIDNSTNENI